MNGVRGFVLLSLGVALVVGVGLSAFASPEPDGLEAAVMRTQCADADDPDACLDELAGEQPVRLAPGPLDDYEVPWLSGLVGVALTFCVGSGLVAAARAGRRRSSTSAGG